jgi:hypothetical protein
LILSVRVGCLLEVRDGRQSQRSAAEGRSCAPDAADNPVYRELVATVETEARDGNFFTLGRRLGDREAQVIVTLGAVTRAIFCHRPILRTRCFYFDHR